MKKLISIAVLLGCVGCNSIPVEVVRVYHDSVGAQYKAYVDADKTLMDDQKRMRKQTVDSMERLLQAVEK